MDTSTVTFGGERESVDAVGKCSIGGGGGRETLDLGEGGADLGQDVMIREFDRRVVRNLLLNLLLAIISSVVE